MMDFGFDLAGYTDPKIKRGAALSVIGAILEATPVIVAVVVLTPALQGAPPLLSPLTLAGGLAGALVLTWVFKAAGSVDSFVATYGLVAASRLRLIDHLRRLPMGFWSKQRSGAVSSVLTDDFALYTEIATHAWSLMVTNMMLPICVGLALMVVDPWVGLAAVAPVPLAFAAIPWSYRLLNKAASALNVEKKRAVALMVEHVQGIAALRALGRHTPRHAQLRGQLEVLEAQMMRTELAPAPAILTYGLLVNLGYALALLAVAWRVGAGALSAERGLLALVLAIALARSLSDLSLFLAQARFASLTLQRIRGLFDTPAQLSVEEAPELGPLELALDGVSFAYDDRPALRDVDARFKPGTVSALVGPSGSGKSTLAHLLSRLWDPDAGRITLGGVDLRELPLSELQARVAVVFQDVVLFQDSVLENLRLGRPDAPREEVIAAAKAARAHDFIEALPQGYDTPLGPGGADLSGGQRQRLSIARALLKDAPILVLDEATANVDPDNEHQIQDAINALMRGRTVIVVAHRLWTVQHADQLLVLQDGAVVERGTHGALLAEGGLYRRMWDAQRESQRWQLTDLPTS